MPTEYATRKNFRLKKADAKLLGPIMEKIEKRDGVLTPGALVKAAKANSSKIHHLFPWDDAVAAARYRLELARYYMRAVTEVGLVDDPKLEKKLSRNVHVVTESGPGYVHVKRAAANPSQRKQILRQARAYLVAFQRKYAVLKEYCVAVDELVAQIDRDLAKAKRKAKRKKKPATKAKKKVAKKKR